MDKTTESKESILLVSSGSMLPESTPLTERNDVAPIVYYTAEVWLTIQHIVKVSTGEIGWLGLVEEGDGYYIIREVFILKQVVTGTTTEIEPEAMLDLTMQLLDEDKDPSMLRYWGHSHVNMQVRPSGTDEKQVSEYLKHANWFIRGIYNKRNDSKVDVYDVPGDVIHQCVENTIIPRRLSKDAIAEIDKILKENISRPTPKPYTHQTNRHIPNQQYPLPGNGLNTISKPYHYPAYDDDYDDDIADEAYASQLNAEESYMLNQIDPADLSGAEHMAICEFMNLDHDPDLLFTQEEIFHYRLADPFYIGD